MSARCGWFGVFLLAACSSTTNVGGQPTGSGSTGQTGASSTGTTAATSSGVASTSTSGTTSTSGAASSTTGSSGTSGSLGYQPYDAGPFTGPFPPPDSGCPIWAPRVNDAGYCFQCETNPDCPAPLVCDSLRGFCEPCDATDPVCPAGSFCDPSEDTCSPDCRLDAGICTPTGANGVYCDQTSGSCGLGCLADTDCPALNPVCLSISILSGPSVCGQCTGFGPAVTCPLPEDVCVNPNISTGSCEFDCRNDAGACRPGICDLSGGSGAAICAPNACFNDSDCVGGPNPRCSAVGGGRGSCVACLTQQDCLAQGAGMPLCAEGTCTASCRASDGGLLACGPEQCVLANKLDPFGDNLGGYQCSCGSDADCAGQTRAPTCVPYSDAGLDGGAGLWGACGCVAGGCGAGAVCETRSSVLQVIAPQFTDPQLASSGLCVPDCGAGGLDCAAAARGLVCNSATGFCVECTGDSQCSADATAPVCVPTGAPIGGGVCGCNGPADCTAGMACKNAGSVSAYCTAACLRTPDGFDSCLYGVNGFQGTAYVGRCNTETGVCQQCFTDADCATLYSTFGLEVNVDTPLCSPQGNCHSCNTAADCPLKAPGCVAGQCGSCNSTADCPAWAPQCVTTAPVAGPVRICVPSCTAGGGECVDAGMTTVCDVDAGHCVQCATLSDCSQFSSACTGGYCN